MAAPRAIVRGEKLTAENLQQRLERAGYSPAQESSVGSFSAFGDTVDIKPGPLSVSGGNALMPSGSKG
jgi:transcription-repair coupling factor (superfamily II helicase)